MLNNARVCPKCGNPLHIYVANDVEVGTCVLDPACSRKGITLEINKLLALTDEEVGGYHALQLQRENDEYTARLEARQQERAAAYLALYGKPMPETLG